MTSRKIILGSCVGLLAGTLAASATAQTPGGKGTGTTTGSKTTGTTTTTTATPTGTRTTLGTGGTGITTPTGAAAPGGSGSPAAAPTGPTAGEIAMIALLRAIIAVQFMMVDAGIRFDSELAVLQFLAQLYEAN